jgi:hypothetical protein
MQIIEIHCENEIKFLRAKISEMHAEYNKYTYFN